MDEPITVDVLKAVVLLGGVCLYVFSDGEVRHRTYPGDFAESFSGKLCSTEMCTFKLWCESNISRQLYRVHFLNYARHV